MHLKGTDVHDVTMQDKAVLCALSFTAVVSLMSFFIYFFCSLFYCCSESLLLLEQVSFTFGAGLFYFYRILMITYELSSSCGAATSRT